jgi:ABC-type glycerol-3-phosphate transport system substrate-binding protein
MKSSFQTILLIVFVIGFVIAIAIFSGLFSSSKSASTSVIPVGHVVLWGTVPYEAMQTYINNFNGMGYGYTLSYTQHTPASFYQDIITALANDASPDLVLISSEQYSQIGSKLFTIPFTVTPERQFRDTNIDGTQLFLTAKGISALPLVVDPLVVYYNKDLLAAKNFVSLPKTWDDLQAAAPILTKRDSKRAITQSAIALGGADNILHARDILSALFLQTGNSIVAYDAVTATYRSTLNNPSRGAALTDALPTEQALNFYTSFVNPTTNNYTWNSSLPESLQNFLAGKSVFYIGRASELFSIQSQNPNLNFDVTQLFQSSAATRPVTFGSFIAVGIMSKAPNAPAANAAAVQMANSTNIDTLSKALSLPPVRRDLLQVAQNNPYISVFFQAALSSFSWPDPNPVSTTKIFRDMITNVNSNTTDTPAAVANATRDLQSSIQQQ